MNTWFESYGQMLEVALVAVSTIIAIITFFYCNCQGLDAHKKH